MPCPNKNMPQWQNLVAALGSEGEALAVFTLNKYEIPSIADANTILEQWRSGRFAENAEWNIALKEKKLARINEQLATMDRIIRSTPKDGRQDVFNKLRENLEEYKRIVENDEPTISVTNLTAGGEIEDMEKYKNYQEFGTFMHHVVETLQKETIGTSLSIVDLLTKEKLQKIFSEYGKEFRISSLIEDGNILKMDELFRMTNNILASLQHYISLGHTILPEISVVTKDRLGRNIVGRLDILTVDKTGKTNVLDLKTKKINAASNGDSLSYNWPVNSSEYTDSKFKGGSRNTYDNWDIQLGIYARMLQKIGIQPDEKIILKLLYAGAYTNPEGKQFDALGNDTFDYTYFKVGSYRSSKFDKGDIFEEMRFDNFMKIINEVLPIEGEKAEEVKEENKDSFIYNLSEEDANTLLEKIKKITEDQLQEAAKQLRIQEKAGDKNLIDYYNERIRTLNHIKSSFTTENQEWKSSHKIGLIISTLAIDMEQIASTVNNIKSEAKTDAEFLQRAIDLQKLNNISVAYNLFLEDIKNMLIENTTVNKKDDKINKMLNSIQENIRTVRGVYNRLGFKSTMQILKGAITDEQSERISETRRQALEPELKYLRNKRDELAQGKKGVGLWNRLASPFKGTVTPQDQIEKIDFQIAKLEAELEGIKFDDKGLEAYINAIHDPNSQLYIGEGTSFGTSVIAGAASNDLMVSAFANHLKIALANGSSEHVNFIEREGMQQEFDKFKAGETNVTELNERVSEVRKTISFDENGNEVVIETRAFANPLSEEYYNMFDRHYQSLSVLNKKIQAASEQSEIDALRAEKSEIINKFLAWRLDNTQMKLNRELYELDKLLPAEYKEKRDELYKEKNILEKSAGFNNAENVDETTAYRIAEIEVELNKLRKEYIDKEGGDLENYLNLMDKYYDYEINYNYFERLKAQKIADLTDINGNVDEVALAKWMDENTIKRPTQEWYDLVGETWDQIFGILGKQNPAIEELQKRYKEILSQYKRKGAVDIRFISKEDRETLNEIEELISQYKAAQASTGLTWEDRAELTSLFQDLEVIQTKVENPFYLKEFNLRIDSLDQKWNRYNEENDATAKDEALAQFLLEEMEFKTWYDDNHVNQYVSKIISNEGLNPLPKKYNMLTVPSSPDMFELKPDHKFTHRKLKEEAYNPDYQEDFNGYPMPLGTTRDGANVQGNSPWLSRKYVDIRNNPRNAAFYNSFVSRYLKMQEETTGRNLGYNFPGYEQQSIDQYSNEGLLKGIKNRVKLFRDKHLVIGSEYDYTINNFRRGGQDRIQFRHNMTLPLAEQTRDGIGAVLRWYENAHVNKAMAEVQPMSKAVIAFMEYQSQMISMSDLENKDEKLVQIKTVIEQMKFEYDKFVKGQWKKDETPWTKFGDLALRGIGFTRLAFDIPNQIGNLLSGNVQTFLGSHKSGFYSAKNYQWAKAKVYGWKDGLIASLMKDMGKFGNRTFMTNMLLYWNPQQKGLEEYYNKTRSNGQRLAQGAVDLEAGFFLMDKGELEISSTIWLSILDNIKVKVIASRNPDGTIAEYEKNTDGTIKTINAFEAYVQNANGEIVIRDDVDWDKQREAAARKTVYSEIRRIAGRYGEWDKAKVESGFGGRLLMYYKKYLEPAVTNRFGRRKENWEAGEMAYGYYRGLITAIKTEGYWNVTKSIFGKPETETGVSDFYQRKSQMAAREMAIGIAMYILGNIIKGSIPDDKEDDDKYLGRTALLGLVAVYAKMDSETRSLIPLPVFGGLDSYIQSAGEFTNANRDLLKVYSALEHSLFLFGSMFTDNKFVQGQAYYQKKAGKFNKGDAKVKKDLMDLSGYMNIYETFYPRDKVKNSFLNRR